MDCTIHGILQARILEWVAIPFSRGSSQTGMEVGSPALQVDSLPTGLSGKPKRVNNNKLDWNKGIQAGFIFIEDLLCARLLWAVLRME